MQKNINTFFVYILYLESDLIFYKKIASLLMIYCFTSILRLMEWKRTPNPSYLEAVGESLFVYARVEMLKVMSATNGMQLYSIL